MDAAQRLFHAVHDDLGVGEGFLQRDGQRDRATSTNNGEVFAAVGVLQTLAEQCERLAFRVGSERLAHARDRHLNLCTPRGVVDDVLLQLLCHLSRVHASRDAQVQLRFRARVDRVDCLRNRGRGKADHG